jgi:predicted enzyme related to lactoylglutathione lyase
MDRVVHFEIPATDMKRANKFYRSIFGWKLEKVPKMEYYMATTVPSGKNRMPKESGAINGALMEKTNAKTPVLVIDVPSLDKYLKKIEKAGGKIVMKKQEVMGMGLYARILDTEGNLIGVWETIKK